MNFRFIAFLIALLISFPGASAEPADHPYETIDHTRNAFGNPFPSLNRDERRLFFVGNSFFRQNWVEAPATTNVRDGLGPTFNAVSCTACHQLNGRGIGAQEGFAHVSLLFRLDGAPAYGGQLNPFGVTDVSGEAHPYVSFISFSGKFDDGEKFDLRKPLFNIVDWMFGPPPAHTRVSARVANQLIGLGLLEKIPAKEIEALADPDDNNGDGISGRANYVLNVRTKQMQLGRFGWKAEVPTVEQQSAAAFNGDMGLTTSLFPDKNCPPGQTACANAVSGGSPEVDDDILARVTLFSQSIAVPVQRPVPSDAGEKTFKRIGCASCHQPSYNVNGVAIFPYTDLLLHDMGQGLSDVATSGEVLPTEWRTPPLWGIGLLHVVNGHTNLMHDGRARGVSEAILWHDGEAASAKKAYLGLSKIQRNELVQFVESL